MATDPRPDSKPPAASAPPAMTPYAIAVALFAAFVVGGVLGRSCRYGWSLLPVSRSEPPCSTSSTATRACPGAGRHDGPDTVRRLGRR
jgi:hypothetical protein